MRLQILISQNSLIIIFKQKHMKYTHNALTSITVQKVQNITTSMTRAGLGDDTYRRQRQKQRYLKCKQQQIQKQQQMRDQFMKQRNEKIHEVQIITQKKNLRRQKKKQRQKQLKKKLKLLKKIDGIEVSCSEDEDSQEKNDEQDAVSRQQQEGGQGKQQDKKEEGKQQ